MSFHTNLNTTHTTHPPVTDHVPEPHPVLPTTPWHHTPTGSAARRRAVGVELIQLGANARPETNGVIPAEWYCELTWPVRPLSGIETTADFSWLVVAEADLGAEIGRVLGDDLGVTVLAPSALAEHADEAALVDALAGVTHVLYAPQVSSTFADVDSGYWLFNAARRLMAALAAMAQPPRLFSADPQCPADLRR